MFCNCSEQRRVAVAPTLWSPELQNLSELSVKGMVEGMPRVSVPEEACHDCVQCKQTKSKFSKFVATKTTKELELVYSDLFRPLPVETPGGNRYFVTFTDDYTKKLWTFCLKCKNEVFDTFRRFKTLAEKQSGCMIQRLRSDGGGEYNSLEFQNFLAEMGITHEVTLPHTPQHNGTAERRNRTLLNMVRCMLKSKNVPMYMWGEAIATSTYILNCTPTKRLEGITPEEAWSKQKPDVKHLRVFGSLCFHKVPEVQRTKLDDKGKPMVMIGYHTTGGYKLFDLETKSVTISRNVVFDEASNWEWEKNKVNEAAEVVPVIALEPDDVADSGEIEPEEDVQQLRRSQRQGQQPTRFRDYELFGVVTKEGNPVHFALAAEAEPVEFEDAVRDEKWRKAMCEEIESIERNGTWRLVNLPPHKRPIALKWVFKVKVNPKGEVIRHKARLEAKGYLQKAGTDFGEIYAPVARLDSIRVIIAIATLNKWRVHQLDVKAAFLNGLLEEEVYVTQPPGFEVKDDKLKVYKLIKALYGLKQAPRAWNKRIDQFMHQIGFERCTTEQGLYVKYWISNGQEEKLLVCLYVDDMLVTGSKAEYINQFKHQMTTEFEMSDLGELNYFLGIEFMQTDHGMLMH